MTRVRVDHCILETLDPKHRMVSSERYLKVDRGNGENLIPYEEAYTLIQSPVAVAKWLRNHGVDFDLLTISGTDYTPEQLETPGD